MTDWSKKRSKALDTLNRVFEDGVDQVQATAEDFEKRLRRDMREIAGKTREAIKQGKEQASEAGEYLASTAKENPLATSIALVGLLAIIGGLIFTASRRNRQE